MEKFSIGILTWKSYNTLYNTLRSYKENGLLDLTDDVILFCQEVSDIDLKIAEEFNITHVIGKSENVGIGKAFNELFKAAKYDKVLILENDWVLIENKEVTEKVIENSILALNDVVDFMRLRHVKNPGDPLYTRQFQNDEMKSPEHLLDAIHWRGEALAEIFPDKIGIGKNYLFTSSKFGNHTNNPFLCTKKFYNENIRPYTGEGIELEGKIREHWQKSNHIVAHNTIGLFTHYRIDR